MSQADILNLPLDKREDIIIMMYDAKTCDGFWQDHLDLCKSRSKSFNGDTINSTNLGKLAKD